MATNMEVAARSLKLAQKEGYDDFRAEIKSINTGRYIYYIIGVNVVGKGIVILVEKRRTNGLAIGNVVIEKFSPYGLEYNNKIMGSLPDSVVKAIKQFASIYNKR